MLRFFMRKTARKYGRRIVFCLWLLYNKSLHNKEFEVIQMKAFLKLLEKNCTMDRDQLAAMAGMTREEVDSTIAKLEKEGIIRGYQALIDWESVEPERVSALIQVNVTPQTADGYDAIADQIMEYDEVESLYLMSGGFDFVVLLSNCTLREVAEFVARRLAPIDGVTGTATHFVLNRYKEQRVSFRKWNAPQERFVFE